MGGNLFNQAVPARIPLTVSLVKAGNDIIARGIAQDETIFEHVHFASLEEAYRYMERTYKVRYRVIFNIHPSCKDPR